MSDPSVCPSCAHENRSGAKFCEECAAPLKRTCASCGSELRPTSKFCDECGAPAAGTTPAARTVAPGGARKIVTVVFADLAGSTGLHERLDPESARRVMERYYETLRAAVERHGGTVVKLLGDGVMAAFGVPQVAEDDAIRAVRAGVAMQEAFRDLAGEHGAVLADAGLRVAVNTGEVVVSDANDDVVGDPVNVAARLQQEAGNGDVVIGEPTRRLIAMLVTLEPLGSFALKGRAEAVKAHRVVSLEAPAGATAAAFVGRDEELARITAVYEQAVTTPATRLAVLLGSPGLGKSRLIAEFARRSADVATVVEARCDAAGGATFAPLADALHELLGVEANAPVDAARAAIEAALPGDVADRARIAAGVAALLGGAPAAPEETFFVVRRLLAGFAATKPVVLVIDDLQWAEPLLLDLVEHLVQWGGGVPLLVLVGGRPELRDVRSSLAAPGGSVSDVLTLAGLDAGAAMRLAANVIGAADLPAVVAAKVLATSEGNPLFIGELVRMLVHEGALTREGGRWTIGTALATLEMPPTIHALLAARIERLRPEDRTILERASVVGRHFSRSAVAELLPGDGADLDARLESLRRGELIERESGWFLGEPVLRFHHMLIRDAAYRRLLKETRAELHARLANWIEARVGGAPEHDETIGRHLEQAHELLGELGPVDAAGRWLGERAAAHLAAAGRHALARDDVPLAASLLGRALARLDASDVARADLALDWCEALLAAGDVGPAAAAIDELGRFTATSPRLRAWHTCFVGQHTVLTAPEALRGTAESVAAAADDLTALGDAAGEAKAHFVHALALARLGQVGACEAALDRALAAARRANDRRRANTVLAIAPLAALWGPSPVTRASGRCLDVVRVLRITQGAPAVEAVALSCQGVLEALRGRTDAAKRMIASAREMVEELGIAQRLFETDAFAGLVALLEGDGAGAERSLRIAYDGFRDLGLGIDAARAAALLARALLAQDRAAEAEALSHESEALAGDDLKAAIAWRGVRAEALARRGDHAAAVEFATAAVEIAAATDALLDHADARLALAVAFRAAGRDRDADAEERRAGELWHAKGATLLVELAGRPPAANTGVAVDSEPPRRPTARAPVTPNLSTTMLARHDTAMANRDLDGLRAVVREDFVEIDHTLGSRYGVDETMASLRLFLGSQDARYRVEPLATLGPRLLLARRHSSASGATSERYDVGPYENEAILVLEADDRALMARSEVFAHDQLGIAIARLYERHAELAPERPGRDRAATTARLVKAMLAQSSERLEDVMAPDVQAVDHRTVGGGPAGGIDLWARWRSASEGLASDATYRVEDVLALGMEGLLRRTTESGRIRATGGTFTNTSLLLSIFGPDGRQSRFEMFDLGHEAEALARYEELTAHSALLDSPRRRVRGNAATKCQARFVAAFAARDVDAMNAAYADDFEEHDHPTGSTFGRDGSVASARRLLGTRNPHLSQDPLATLGDSLVLVRRLVRTDGFSGGNFDVGPYEYEAFHVTEVDERGLARRTEVFAADRLGEAIARLYERDAALLPAGPGQERATRTAQAAGNILAYAPNLMQYATALSPALESHDRRTLGLGLVHGAAQYMRGWRALFQLVESFSTRIDDVLRVLRDGFVVRGTMAGTHREEGGVVEFTALLVATVGPDGLFSHLDWFDVEQEAEALARFEALTGPTEPRRRRVRGNAATAWMARFDAAFAAHDVDVIGSLYTERFEEVSHPTGTTYGRDGSLASIQHMFRARDPRHRHEPLATLGDSLVLARRALRGDGVSSGRFDVGAYEAEVIQVMEVDERGIACRAEIFAADRLDDGIVRLYERYAELLGDGPERTCAAATAQALRAALGPPDVDGLVTGFDPDVEFVDHRTLGTWSWRGLDAMRAHLSGLTEVADDVAWPDDDVLGLRPDAVLVRRVHTGTARAGGGRYERRFLFLAVRGPDGLVVRVEFFDVEQEAEALARFDALTGEQPATERFANAATRAAEHNIALWERKDWGPFDACFAPSFRLSERRRSIQLELDREAALEFMRSLGDDMVSRRIRTETLATRGDRLALGLWRIELVGGDVGASEIRYLSLFEVDEHGATTSIVRWDEDAWDDARAELDRRFEEDQGASRSPAWQSIREFVRAAAGGDWDAIGALCADEFVEYDHRGLAVLGTTQGADAWVQNFRTLADLSRDTVYRVDHFRVAARGYYTHGGWHGTRDGGPYEIPLHAVIELDDSGRIVRADIYDDDGNDTARGRFAELAAPAAPPEPFANAATRLNERYAAAWAAHDFDAMVTLFAPSAGFDDRRRLVGGRLSASTGIDATRFLFDMPGSRMTITPIATRGERCVLSRAVYEAEGTHGGGPIAIDYLSVDSLDAEGRFTTVTLFDLDDLDAAYAELDARFGAEEGAGLPAAAYIRNFVAALHRRDWEAVTECYAADLVSHDHRLVGWGTLNGRDALVMALEDLVALAPDVRLRTDHLRASPGAAIAQSAWVGTRDGGAFESEFLSVGEIDGQGRARRLDFYDLRHLDAAMARFEEIRASVAATAKGPTQTTTLNAAGAAMERWQAAFDRGFETDDWSAMYALCAPGLVFEDRRALNRLIGDVEMMVASGRERALSGARPNRRPVGDAGDRVTVQMLTWEGGPPDGPFEIEYHGVIEADEAARVVAVVLMDDAHTAQREAWARWAAIDPSMASLLENLGEVLDAWNTQDLERLRAAMRKDLIVADHRLTGTGLSGDREAYLRSVAALWKLAPESRLEHGWHWLATAPHVALYDARRIGVVPGGGEFESEFLVLAVERDGKTARLEIFEADDSAAALARFEELRSSLDREGPA